MVEIKKALFIIVSIVLGLSLFSINTQAVTYQIDQNWNSSSATNFNVPLRFSGSYIYIGSNFQANKSYSMTNVTVRLKAFGTPSGNMWLGLYNANNTTDVDTSPRIAVSNNISAGTISTGANGAEYNLSLNATIVSGNYYALVWEGDYVSSGVNYVRPGSINTGGTYKSYYDGDFVKPFSFDILGYTWGFMGWSCATGCSSGITVTAVDVYNATALSVFNATVNGTLYTTTNGTINLNASNASVNITINAHNYFNKTYTDWNLTNSLAANMTPYTLIRAIPMGLSTPINNFTINYTNNANNSENGSVLTTNSYIYIPLYNATYSVLIYDAFNNTQVYAQQTQNLTASTYLQAYNFSLFNSNSLNVGIYDEQTNTLLNGTNFDFQVISDSYAFNFSTSNGTYNATFLIPEDYQIIYNGSFNGTNYRTREYYFTLTNQSVSNLRLYDITTTASDYFTAKETDPYGEACGGQTLSLLRYYIDINGYRIVEMAKTNTLGEAIFSVEPNTVNYKINFEGTCGSFTSDPSKLTSSTQTFVVTDAQSTLEAVNGYDQVSKSLTFNNVTDTFVFTWSGGTVVEQGCFYVTKINATNTSSVSSSCTTATSGSLIYTATEFNGTSYTATGTLEIADNIISDTITHSYPRSSPGFNGFGLVGVALTLIVLLFVVFAMGGSTESTVIGGVFAIFLMGTFGFIFNTYTSLIGMAIVAVIIMYKTRT